MIELYFKVAQRSVETEHLDCGHFRQCKHLTQFICAPIHGPIRRHLCSFIILQAGDLLCSPPAAPDSDIFHHIATYLHTYTCML